ncbi:MAG: hypothetical protein PHG66_04930 [Candidatus Colwellbacteria bacterium]|nr:hypothetical protein [Candidatus Colwellbacteria bacterium]
MSVIADTQNEVTEYNVGKRFKRDQTSFPISLVTHKYPLRVITPSEKKMIKEMTSNWIGDHPRVTVKKDPVKRWFYERKGSTWVYKKTEFGYGTEELYKTLRQGYDVWMSDKSKDVAICDSLRGYHQQWWFNFTKMKMIPPGIYDEITSYDISFTENIFDFDNEFPRQKEITILSEPDESLLKPVSLGYTESSLHPSCVEYEFLNTFFKQHQTSNQYKIDSITKISNTVQARKYHFQRSLMSNPRELLLFHHSSSNESGRLTNSLDMRSYQSITMVVGTANYLSDNVEFTHRYSKNKNKLYLVKCLVGGSDNHGENPSPVVRPGDGFDSVTYKTNKTNVFAIYSNDQCYISYVLNVSPVSKYNYE